MRTDIYQSPLCERYASKEMQNIFSNDRKFSTWRKLWIALAESEQELGLPISDEQIEEMKAQIDNIDYEKARQYESELRHDVMAHVLFLSFCFRQINRRDTLLLPSRLPRALRPCPKA